MSEIRNYNLSTKSRKQIVKTQIRMLMLVIAVAAAAVGTGLLVYGSGVKKMGSQGNENAGLEMQTTETEGENRIGKDGESENWKLVLVNPWNPLSKKQAITAVTLRNGQSIDERCLPELQQMMDDCRARGLSPIICSSYRSWDKQEKLFEEHKRKLMLDGYTEEEADKETGKSIAVPGTSEHQLGLALDIVDSSYQNLDSDQENTEVQKWLIQNSWKYGFILRYPNSKSEITGIIYEPWHYRYVGKEAAKEIYDQNICLEEYLSAS